MNKKVSIKKNYDELIDLYQAEFEAKTEFERTIKLYGFVEEEVEGW